MDYYYNWQRPYHAQYSNNVNPYFNNSYEYLQHPSKNTYYAWNNYIPSQGPGPGSSQSPYNTLQIVSIGSQTPQPPTLTQPSSKTPLPPMTPLPLPVPASTPVSFQSTPIPYYDPFPCQKKKSSKNVKYAEPIYYNHDYNRYSNRSKYEFNEEISISTSIKDLTAIYEHHHTPIHNKFKSAEPIYSTNYNITPKQKHKNQNRNQQQQQQNKKPGRTILINPSKKTIQLRTVLSSEDINDLNKRNYLKNNNSNNNNNNNHNNNKIKTPIIVKPVNFEEKHFVENKPKIKELHVGAKEKSTKKFIDASQKIRENSSNKKVSNKNKRNSIAETSSSISTSSSSSATSLSNSSSTSTSTSSSSSSSRSTIGKIDLKIDDKGINGYTIYSDQNKISQNLYSKSSPKKQNSLYNRYYQSNNNLQLSPQTHPILKLQEKFYQSNHKEESRTEISNNHSKKKSTSNESDSEKDKEIKERDVKEKENSKSKEKEKREVKEVKKPNQLIFKPPNTDELLRPTLRGVPVGLIQNFSDLSLQYLANIELSKNFKNNNFIAQPQKSVSGLIPKFNGIDKKTKPKISTIERHFLNLHFHKKSDDESDKSLSKDAITELKPLKNRAFSYEVIDEKPMSPDLDSYKIQTEKSFFNDNHFTIQNRNGINKFIIREKQKLRRPNQIRSRTSSTSTFKKLNDEDDMNNEKLSSSSLNIQIKSNNLFVLNSDKKKPKKAPISPVNKNLYNVKNVYKPPAPAIVSSNKKEKQSNNQNNSKVPIKQQEQIYSKPAINNNIKANQNTDKGKSNTKLPKQPEISYEYIKIKEISKSNKQPKKDPNTNQKKIKQNNVLPDLVMSDLISPNLMSKEIEVNSDYSRESDTRLNEPTYKEHTSLYYKFPSLDNHVKRNQNEKTLSTVGSILDVPLPSENDAFSEYSSFVTNIFSKALEK